MRQPRIWIRWPFAKPTVTVDEELDDTPPAPAVPAAVVWDGKLETVHALRDGLRQTLGHDWTVTSERPHSGRLMIRNEGNPRHIVRLDDRVEFVPGPTPHLLVHPKPSKVPADPINTEAP